MEQTWKRKEYETWEEAFGGLAPAIRQQSVRVAAYTRVLYIQACNSSFGTDTPDSKSRMNGKYAELAYKCGMYHQLGKALVPAEYQIMQKDFTEEEIAVYRKYTTDGRLLAAALQERGARSKLKRSKHIDENTEAATDNVTWLMLREACEQHMERYDGGGYPKGLVANEISPVAQIVGLAKELDRLASETKSENPFGEAFDAVCAESGKAFAPELIDVLREARSKCRTVYNKYVYYTMALPKTIPLVEKKKDRPMGLNYRPLTNGEVGAVRAYEADMWFGAVANRPGETESAAQVEEMLKRTELVTDVSMYFLYEAADALLRIENCKLPIDFLVLNMIPSFYKQGSQLQRLNKLFEDQPIDKSRLLLTVPCETVASAGKGLSELLQRYMKNGITFLLDEWDPAVIPLSKLRELGFKYVRPLTVLYSKTETSVLFTSLVENEINVIARGADSREIILWLSACGVKYMRGTLTGEPVSEDELVRDTLLKEREGLI